MTSARSVLVLGGTSWLGGAAARIARDQGAEVTCLARGDSGTVPAGVRHVVADRWADGAYAEVADRDWDEVLEVGREPELVRSALDALAGRAGHWTYVSSCSVYRDTVTRGNDETAALVDAWTGPGPAADQHYAEAKRACEDATLAAVPGDRLLVARAGLIVGYGDRSDRFGYWPARFAWASAGEDVLVPPADTPAQVIDVLDLAGWLVDAGTRGVSGIFDAIGEPRTMAQVLETCSAVTGCRPTQVPAADAWLVEHGVAPWAGPDSLPVWLPVDEDGGLLARRNDKVRAAGLVSRPLARTVADALAWERELGLHREPRRAGLTRHRERQLLEQLREPTAG